VSLSALVLNNALVLFLEPPLELLVGTPQGGYLLAKICATAVGVCWNFFMNHYWTFNPMAERKGAV
jgi:putative flippase GtrA